MNLIEFEFNLVGNLYGCRDRIYISYIYEDIESSVRWKLLLFRKGQLSDFQRWVVIGLMQSGKSSQQIVDLLGEDWIKMSKSRVLRIINGHPQREAAYKARIWSTEENH